MLFRADGRNQRNNHLIPDKAGTLAWASRNCGLFRPLGEPQ